MLLLLLSSLDMVAVVAVVVETMAAPQLLWEEELKPTAARYTFPRASSPQRSPRQPGLQLQFPARTVQRPFV